MNTYFQVLNKYVDFNGRANRKEYWIFVLYNAIFTVIAILLDNIFKIAISDLGYGPIYGLYVLATFIPALAVKVRRLHDLGKSGWMFFITLIPLIGIIWLIVLLASKGNSSANQYGQISENYQAENQVSDEIILAYICWVFIASAFYGVFPKINLDFFQTSTFKIAQIYIPIISGILPLSFAFLVKNKTKRILLIILGVLIFIYNIYSIIDRLI